MRYRIRPQETVGGQDVIEVYASTIEDIARQLREIFPSRRRGDVVSITAVGVSPNGLDATAENHGFFRIGTGERVPTHC